MILKNAPQVSNPDKGTDTNQFGARTASLRSHLVTESYKVKPPMGPGQ